MAEDTGPARTAEVARSPPPPTEAECMQQTRARDVERTAAKGEVKGRVQLRYPQ